MAKLCLQEESQPALNEVCVSCVEINTLSGARHECFLFRHLVACDEHLFTFICTQINTYLQTYKNQLTNDRLSLNVC